MRFGWRKPPKRRRRGAPIPAYRQACEEGKMDAAELLLRALQLDLTGRGDTNVENREATGMVAAAFELYRDTKAQEDT